MVSWTLKGWLESASYAVVIIGAIAGAVIFIVNMRSKAIETARHDIAQRWTNEGDILSKETAFIDLNIENSDGDLVGILESPRLERPLETHVDVGWRSSTLVISELRGRHLVHIANVSIEVVGNHNRLRWQITSSNPPSYLPRSTTLWPNPVISSR